MIGRDHMFNFPRYWIHASPQRNRLLKVKNELIILKKNMLFTHIPSLQPPYCCSLLQALSRMRSGIDWSPLFNSLSAYYMRNEGRAL